MLLLDCDHIATCLEQSSHVAAHSSIKTQDLVLGVHDGAQEGSNPSGILLVGVDWILGIIPGATLHAADTPHIVAFDRLGTVELEGEVAPFDSRREVAKDGHNIRLDCVDVSTYALVVLVGCEMVVVLDDRHRWIIRADGTASSVHHTDLSSRAGEDDVGWRRGNGPAAKETIQVGNKLILIGGHFVPS